MERPQRNSATVSFRAPCREQPRWPTAYFEDGHHAAELDQDLNKWTNETDKIVMLAIWDPWYGIRMISSMILKTSRGNSDRIHNLKDHGLLFVSLETVLFILKRLALLLINCFQLLMGFWKPFEIWRSGRSFWCFFSLSLSHCFLAEILLFQYFIWFFSYFLFPTISRLFGFFKKIILELYSFRRNKKTGFQRFAKD